MATKRKYDELRIDGPPLFRQGSISREFESPAKKRPSAPPCPPLDASKTALLVVDVQPEYWSECPAVRKDFPEFPSRMSDLISTCRREGAKVIWVRADYSYEHSPWLHQFARIHRGRIPPVVRPSSKWEDFATPLEDETVVTKTSWSSTSRTGLLSSLKNDGVEAVLVCGLITSVCVQHSAFGVFEAGYRTILVTDACADRGRERHEAALALYGDYMYSTMTVDSARSELGLRRALSAAPSFPPLPFEVDAEPREKSIVKSISDGSLTSATGDADGPPSVNVDGDDAEPERKSMVKSVSDGSLSSASDLVDDTPSIDGADGARTAGIE